MDRHIYLSRELDIGERYLLLLVYWARTCVVFIPRAQHNVDLLCICGPRLVGLRFTDVLSADSLLPFSAMQLHWPSRCNFTPPAETPKRKVAGTMPSGT